MHCPTSRAPLNVQELSPACQDHIARVDDLWQTWLTRYGGLWLFGNNMTLADIVCIRVALRLIAYGVPAASVCSSKVLQTKWAQSCQTIHTQGTWGLWMEFLLCLGSILVHKLHQELSFSCCTCHSPTLCKAEIAHITRPIVGIASVPQMKTTKRLHNVKSICAKTEHSNQFWNLKGQFVLIQA